MTRVGRGRDREYINLRSAWCGPKCRPAVTECILDKLFDTSALRLKKSRHLVETIPFLIRGLGCELVIYNLSDKKDTFLGEARLPIGVHLTRLSVRISKSWMIFGKVLADVTTYLLRDQVRSCNLVLVFRINSEVVILL